MPSPRSRPTPSPDVDWRFEAIGTVWEITTDAPLSDAARAEVRAEIDRIDRVWSRFRDDSMVAEMARTPGRYPVAASDAVLLDWYRRLYEITAGAVTPLVGATLADAGYDAQYSLTPASTIAPVPAWDDVIEWRPGDVAGAAGELVVRHPVLLDIGAAGKGFVVDRVAAVVAAHTGGPHVVDAGGDMVISAREHPVRIALEHPGDPRRAIGVVELSGGAVCASAPNRRAWADWHHIVDPHTGRPTREVLATWVFADETTTGPAMTADGLATALFFTPATALQARLGAPQPNRRPGATPTDITWTALEKSGGTTAFGHVIIHHSGVVEHTAIPGLELFL
ncbi:FAD:protein FMN transferase [Gordonia desulfuricans]|uniref:FAD:protein FMN transferase n=1 Tax=Gordonia desulfuricans TaxID=89051 RepID=A0A7K3LRJ2_9ACTN|nr:FAD:protein FMN transferase [Gordonia desulfuricans]NDK90838.1 FAD:protein FMN transferase [Gordonia desulfuricans]